MKKLKTQELRTQDWETLEIEDIMQIFNFRTKTSVYRRLRGAREGRGGLPLPIPSGPKQRLRWNKATVKQFLESAVSEPPAPQPIESAAKRAARNRAALKELEKFGIKTQKMENEK